MPPDRNLFATVLHGMLLDRGARRGLQGAAFARNERGHYYGRTRYCVRANGKKLIFWFLRPRTQSTVPEHGRLQRASWK